MSQKLRFQCSSASRKFLNPETDCRNSSRGSGFSALQRAENSSIHGSPGVERIYQWGFSALQRAENSSIFRIRRNGTQFFGFSALQRAENSSIVYRGSDRPQACSFSALQRAENSSILVPDETASDTLEFQCSSASRKFLNANTAPYPLAYQPFQCSSASRKFLNLRTFSALRTRW